MVDVTLTTVLEIQDAVSPIVSGTEDSRHVVSRIVVVESGRVVTVVENVVVIPVSVIVSNSVRVATSTQEAMVPGRVRDRARCSEVVAVDDGQKRGQRES